VILLIDNYDSFSYNLAHLFGALGADVVVRRNDELDADEAERLAPSHLVVSPGPGRPAAAGATPAIVERLLPTTPTLGVCLGHQALVEVCGGEVGYARELVHGKASPVATTAAALHRSPGSVRSRALSLARRDAAAGRARADGVRGRRRGDGRAHREFPAVGVQFHPESVLTPDGPVLARNFLEGTL
jgi:glutamine amidotransferase of anthranilate synthase or aminodeoxychorismate synthase